MGRLAVVSGGATFSAATVMEVSFHDSLTMSLYFPNLSFLKPSILTILPTQVAVGPVLPRNGTLSVGMILQRTMMTCSLWLMSTPPAT